jgi:lysophospholipase L1-like esterase
MADYTYLALGDSYTIGEGVRLAESFPYQAVQLLRKMNLPFRAPEIIAVTGWTTAELDAAINGTKLLTCYNIVSLLIGVNDQYRGGSATAYGSAFEQLLRRSIGFAGGNSRNVFVLSIPDWGVTPFASGRDCGKISEEIDAFNAANKQICGLCNVQYIDTTEQQRVNGGKEDFLAADKLHPSGREYAEWAIKLAQLIGGAGV